MLFRSARKSGVEAVRPGAVVEGNGSSKITDLRVSPFTPLQDKASFLIAFESAAGMEAPRCSAVRGRCCSRRVRFHSVQQSPEWQRDRFRLRLRSRRPLARRLSVTVISSEVAEGTSLARIFGASVHMVEVGLCIARFGNDESLPVSSFGRGLPGPTA